MPSDCESASINAALATTATSTALGWVNPFAAPARVGVLLHSSEQPGTFSLQLKGAEAVQQQPAAAVADKRGLRRSGTSSRSASSLQGRGEQEVDNVALDAEDDDDDDDHLERHLQGVADASAQDDDPLAGLLAAATGTAPSWADKHSSNGPQIRHTAGSKHHKHQQQPQEQQQLVVLQQVAEVTVPPNSQLQLHVSFCPQLLREAAAEIHVSLVSPAVLSPEPLLWRYEVRGLAHADARGVKFAVKCKAKQSVDEVLPLPLPGLDPAVAAAAAAAAVGNSQQQHQQQQQQQMPSTVKFSHELIIPEDHKAALAAALHVEQVDQLPVVGLPGAEAGPVLRLRLHFAPQKAVAATVQLAVKCSTGARWVYDVNLLVSVYRCLAGVY
jgi:hypothetical protein